jgi:hypothetical protein
VVDLDYRPYSFCVRLNERTQRQALPWCGSDKAAGAVS